MKIVLSENQFNNLLQNFNKKKPVAGGSYASVKSELIQQAQTDNNIAFGEGKSQNQTVAKEIALNVATAELKKKTGKESPYYTVADRLFKIDNMYHQLILIELG